MLFHYLVVLVLLKGSFLCQTVKPYQQNCTPFFYFLNAIKSIFPLKHTQKAASGLNYKIKTALENAVNKPFSRAAFFILSSAVRLSQRGLRGQNECHLCMSVLGNISTTLFALSVDGNISIGFAVF